MDYFIVVNDGHGVRLFGVIRLFSPLEPVSGLFERKSQLEMRGGMIGVYLDRRFETSPWLTFIFLGLGIAAGYRNIGLAIKKSRKL